MSSASKALILASALAVLAFAWARAATDQSAQSHDSSSATDELKEVTVTAQRARLATTVPTPPPQQVTIEGHRQELKKEIHDYVSGVTQGPAGTSDDPLQRWREPMCFLVAGLHSPYREFVLQRLSTAAGSAGAPITKRHCRRPNFYVVFTSQPQWLLHKWRRRDPSMYGSFPAPMLVKEFQDATAPVRAWYNAALEGVASGGATSLECDSLKGVPCGRSLGGGLEYGFVRDFQSVIVLVDLNKVEGLHLSTVTDYVAMVGMARVHVSPEVGSAPTILRLFGSFDERPTGLTSWDKSFLRALYNTRQEVRGQRGEIAEHMRHDIAP